MKITYVRLFKFKRFPLRDLELFEQEFNSKLLMISGPNGAGKSSLFNELTPLPSDKNDFYPGGYKEIKIEKDNNQYVLLSDFRDGTHFSFIMNEEELNTAGIITTQRELVAQHFKITPGIHDIMIGKENFTNMSLPARKKLFSAITHLNIDKVLEGYNKLKEQEKTNTSILKSLTASYITEEQKLVDKERIATLKSDLEATKARMDSLLEMRSELQRYAPATSSEEVYKTVTGLELMINVLINPNRMLITAYPNRDIERLSNSNYANLSLVNHKLNEVYSELDKRQRELRDVESSGVNNRQALLDEKIRTEDYVVRMKDSLKIFKDHSGITEASYMALYKLEAALPEILRNLQTNIGLEGEKIYTTERYNRTVEEKRRLVERLQELNAMEISIKHSLVAANETQGNVECPKCSHSWPIKEALTASIHAKEEIEAIHIEQNKIRSAMGSVERSIDELTEYFTLYKQYSILRKETHEVLLPFWESVNSKELVFSDPTSILSVLNLAGLELSNLIEIKNALVDLDLIDRKLETIKNHETVNIELVKNRINELNEDATELQLTKRELNQQTVYIQKAKAVYEQLTKLNESLLTAKKDLTEFNIDHLVSEITTVIEDEIRNLRINYITMEKEIHQSDTIQYTLDRYQKEIDDVKENIKVLNLAIVELCPKSGLIAKSVSSFLNTIIKNVNVVIGKIWEYKMILKPIDVESDSLNYKFKVEVEDKLSIPDVAVCSSGMQEIINLSFKMTLYRVLGLENYPIFLDEFGSKLDSTHRSRVMQIIFSMIADPWFSNIFMITHIDTSIASFKDVDVIEL